ncbi:helix-turn-helix domain-containing protein [Mammaliicoccus sp. JADD-157]|uniref:helix-turn-helix domain-containing protein n=1 Tax=Mammaliicoccus sp. JADD-157 TaxID=3404818 RepID=UPI003BB69883
MEHLPYEQLRADVESVLSDDTLTAYKLEQLSGVSRSTLTRLKNGERYIDRLSLETCERIASVKYLNES